MIKVSYMDHQTVMDLINFLRKSFNGESFDRKLIELFEQKRNDVNLNIFLSNFAEKLTDVYSLSTLLNNLIKNIRGPMKIEERENILILFRACNDLVEIIDNFIELNNSSEGGDDLGKQRINLNENFKIFIENLIVFTNNMKVEN